MSNVKRFFDKEVVVRRLRDSGSTQSFQATATADCAIQELSPQARSLLGDIVSGRSWQAWFDVDDDIQEGDKLTDGDGNVYIVREVTKKDYGTNQHLEVLMEEHNA